VAIAKKRFIGRFLSPANFDFSALARLPPPAKALLIPAIRGMSGNGVVSMRPGLTGTLLAQAHAPYRGTVQSPRPAVLAGCSIAPGNGTGGCPSSAPLRQRAVSVVSDSTLTSRVNAARRAVGDSGEEQKLIRTIARKGMCFVGDVHTQAGQDEASHGQSVGETRKIAAIAGADVVGYGRLAAADEERILARLLRAPQRSD
jgi:hypothetical protein